MNQAKTTISIVKEKALEKEVKVLKSGGSKDMIESSGGEMCGGMKGNVWKLQFITVKLEKGLRPCKHFVFLLF